MATHPRGKLIRKRGEADATEGAGPVVPDQKIAGAAQKEQRQILTAKKSDDLKALSIRDRRDAAARRSTNRPQAATRADRIAARKNRRANMGGDKSIASTTNESEKTSPTSQNKGDDASVASDDSSKVSDHSAGPERPMALADKLAEIRKAPKKDRESKNTILSAHLKAQKEEKAGRKLNRHGDEISLGTLELEKKKKEDKKTKKKGGVVFDAPVMSMTTKQQRPWVGFTSKHFGTNGTIKEENKGKGSSSNNNKKVDGDFFEMNIDVFERSAFNFDTSFASRVSEEEERSKVPNDEMMSIGGEDSHIPMESGEFAGFDENEFEGAESNKFSSKIKDKEIEFDDAWENTETDKNVAAQISQKREERQKNKAKAAKGEDGQDEVPRLFLFEGEKKKRKKRKKKKKKLENKLSKEFRRAMQEVFNDDAEEKYDKTFGEGGFEISRQSKRRGSHSSDFITDDDDEISAQSSKSGGDGSDASDGFGDDYLKRLRNRSMQNEVKNLLYGGGGGGDDNKSQKSKRSEGSDNGSHASRRLRRASSTDTLSRDLSTRPRRRAKPRVDPVEVYAKEMKKQKEKTKVYSVADIRKEMEDMKKAANANANVNFGDFDSKPGAGAAGKSFNLTSPNKKTKKPTSGANGVGKMGKPASMRPGAAGGVGGPLDALEKMNPSRPGFDRKLSMRSTGSNQGLLSGARTGFDMGEPSAIEENERETSFLNNTRRSSFDADDFGRTSNLGMGSSGGKGGGGLTGGAGNSSIDAPRSHNFGSPFGSSPAGFREPLPLPESNDQDQAKKSKKWGKNIGKGAKKMFKSFKMPAKRGQMELGGSGMGMMDDNDNDEGGMGLLG
jgi:hypothetical protein